MIAVTGPLFLGKLHSSPTQACEAKCSSACSGSACRGLFPAGHVCTGPSRLVTPHRTVKGKEQGGGVTATLCYLKHKARGAGRTVFSVMLVSRPSETQASIPRVFASGNSLRKWLPCISPGHKECTLWDPEEPVVIRTCCHQV